MTETQSMTTFDNLSTELILSIFEYLSVVDRYKSFFDYNIRLRKIVKQWTSYSRQGLDADIKRFSTLHSWYKHLTFEDGGTEFIIIPRKGEQIRHPIDPCINDTTNLHWSFLNNRGLKMIHDERVHEILSRCSFRLNPFFYHEKKHNCSDSKLNGKAEHCVFYGGSIITMDRFRKHFEPWIKSNYPEYADRILNSSSNLNSDIDQECAPIFEAEWLKATQVIRNAAHQVWEELKHLDDVNPLEITQIH